MNDIGERIVKDCAALRPFAEELVGALREGDEERLLRFYEGRSQRRVLKLIFELIDDLGSCRTVDDLPGPDDEVARLRDVSLESFRRMSKWVGDPFGLTLYFRAEAAEFFRGLMKRDPGLLDRIRCRRERELARSLLTCAMKVTPYIIRGFASAGLLFAAKSGLRGLIDKKRRDAAVLEGKCRHVKDGLWMRREREEVLRLANDNGFNPDARLPHELARRVWRMNQEAFSKASALPPDKRGYRDDKTLRAHFYPLRDRFVRQREDGVPFAE